MLCVDANVWVYYFDERTQEHETVRPRIAGALDDRTLFCNAAIQTEVVHYFANQVPDTGAYVGRLLGLEGLAVADLRPPDVERAAALLQRHPHLGVGGRDASLVVAMERRGVSELWTHDDGLKRLGGRIDWMRVTDPVAS